MIALRADLKVVLATQPVDFRKPVHTLSALVSEALHATPYCGDVFVFRSKRMDRVKLLAWGAEPRQPGPPDVGTPASTIPMGLRILAMVLRALFIGALVAVTARISSPQSESILTVYETPGDLIRLALGVAGCLWMVIQLFMLPEDEEGYRIWLYLGPVVAPLALAVAIAIW